MKFSLCLGLVVAAAVGGTLRAGDVTPQPYPADRYAKMAAHSPFAPPSAPVATPPPVAAAPTPSIFDKYTVTMLMQNGGVYYATVVEQDTNQHYYLNSKTASPTTQMQISSVKWDPASKNEAPTITLRKDTLFGTVRYESGAGGVGMPGAAPGAVPGVPARPLGVASQPINRVGAGQPMIPGSAAPNPAMPNNPIPPVNGGNIRRPVTIAAPRAQPPPATGGRPIVQPNNSRPGVLPDDDDDDD